ncbi:MAG: MarR family transcriptional regulator [Rhodospirillaceae bacterium]|nr:MarR family transcriptional regulator [Rhodospirillaceae bacterium]
MTTDDKLDQIVAQWQRARPDLDASSMAVFGRLIRLHAHLEREIQNVLNAQGLAPGEFDVLATLRRSNRPEGLSPNELLAEMMITSGTMTHRLDRLEQAGRVERHPHPEDRRSVRVVLSEAGRKLVDQAVQVHLDNQKRLLAGLDQPSQDALSVLLKTWLNQFE